MIEALINPDTGDVIVVKPLGSVWGRCEVNAVVKLDDPELEKELAGGEHVVYPYGAYEVKDGIRALLMQSMVQVMVADAAAMKRVSARPGALRKADADKPTADAIIADVKTPVAKDGGTVVLPARPLPTKSVIVAPLVEEL